MQAARRKKHNLLSWPNQWSIDYSLAPYRREVQPRSLLEHAEERDLAEIQEQCSKKKRLVATR